jgi:hypothetical protein
MPELRGELHNWRTHGVVIGEFHEQLKYSSLVEGIFGALNKYPPLKQVIVVELYCYPLHRLGLDFLELILKKFG